MRQEEEEEEQEVEEEEEEVEEEEEEEEEEWRSRRCGMESGGASVESLPPALSQPHAWLLLLLIVIAVQTRPTAATNISSLI